MPVVLRHWAETNRAHLIATAGVSAPVYTPTKGEIAAERLAGELARKVAELEWKNRQLERHCRLLEQELDFRQLFEDTVPFDPDVDLEEPQPN